MRKIYRIRKSIFRGTYFRCAQFSLPYIWKVLDIIFSIANNPGPLERSYSRLIEQCHKDRYILSIAHMDTHDMIVSVESNNRWIFYDFEGKNEIILLAHHEYCHWNLISFETSFCSFFSFYKKKLKRTDFLFGLFGINYQLLKKDIIPLFQFFIKGKHFDRLLTPPGRN